MAAPGAPAVSAELPATTRADLLRRLEAARRRLEGHARRTPLLASEALQAAAGAAAGEVLLKCENLQRAGAFKFRGAYNALAALREAGEAARGVLTFSSGNHAQALALAGRLLDVPVTVVMPANAPRAKLAATRARGAEVIEYDPARERREVLGQRLAEERGLPVIPPYDHPDVMAGQGTAALEMFAEAGRLDRILVCTGGGGLLGGTALAAALVQPDCRVIGVEPALADDATRSFRSRTLQTVHNPPTIADGARTPWLGRHTFPVVLNLVHDMVTVSEEAICEAVRVLFRDARLVVEPAGALAAAAIVAGAVPAAAAGERTGVLVSGGNVDAEVYAAILRGETPVP